MFKGLRRPRLMHKAGPIAMMPTNKKFRMFSQISTGLQAAFTSLTCQRKQDQKPEECGYQSGVIVCQGDTEQIRYLGAGVVVFWKS